jgi:hypothetical protein
VATGAVQFLVDGTNVGSPQTPSAGTATLSWTPSTAGAHSITATFVGTGAYTNSTSTAFTTNTNATTTTVLTAPGQAKTNQTVVLTANVSSSAATGTINFKNGSSAISGCGTVAVASGAATCSWATGTSTGAKSITAVYTPTAGNGFATSTSAAVSVTVSAAGQNTTTTETVPSTGSTSAAVTMTAKVAPAPTGSTGTIQFKDNGTPIGAALLPDASGNVSLSYTFPANGSHPITATYSGFAGYNTSTSAASTITITTNTTTTVADPGPVTAYTPVTITATVSPNPGGNGTVQFQENGTNIGSPVAVQADGTASTSWTPVATGSRTIIAVYSGGGEFNGSSDDATVAVGAAAPTANAGPPQTVHVGDTVTLDATASTDPGGATLTYSWEQTDGPAVSLSDTTSATPTFTAPSGPETLTFALTIDDGLGVTDTASVTITVANSAPVASAGSDQSVSAGASVTLDATGSTDADGQALAYSWSQTAGAPVTLSSTTDAQPTFTAPVSDFPDTLVFQVTADDGQGGTSTATVTVNVAAVVNAVPTADAGPAQTVHVGDTVTLDGSASADADGDALTYSWVQTSGPAVSLSSATAAQPTFTAPGGPATLGFTLTVSDGHYNHAVSADVTITVANTAPVASAGSNQQVAVSAKVTLDASGSTDPDGGSLTYSWSQTSGPAVPLSSTTAAKPTFTMPSTPNTVSFAVTVTDNGGATSSASVTVSSVVTELSAGPVELPSGLSWAKTTAVVKLSVTNNGNTAVTADPANVTWTAMVNGAPLGDPFVLAAGMAPKKANVGATVAFNFNWNYGMDLHAWDDIVLTGCYHQAGDANATNDCASFTFPQGSIDLATSVTVKNVPTATGSSLRYTVSVFNAGSASVGVDPEMIQTALTINGVPDTVGTTFINSPTGRVLIMPNTTQTWTLTWQSPVVVPKGATQTVTVRIDAPKEVDTGNDVSSASLVKS